MAFIIVDGMAVEEKAILGSQLNFETPLAGSRPFFRVLGNIEPPTTSVAVFNAIRGQLNYNNNASVVSGTGHLVGVLGNILNLHPTNTIPLAIGIEGKIDNAISGANITNAVISELNLGSNVAGANIGNLYFLNANCASNAGAISLLAGLRLDIVNTGTITNVGAVYVPALSNPGTITTLYGLYFGDQTGGGIGVKHCIFCLDANADINTVGPIITTALTTTGTFKLDSGTKTATASSGAATLNKASGKITTESLTAITAGSSYTLTLTNSQIAAADTVFASVDNGTNTIPGVTVTRVSPAAGSVVILLKNTSGSTLDGTCIISFASMKA